MEFLSSSIAQLKVVQTKYVEAKDCLNVLNKSNEGEWDPPPSQLDQGGLCQAPRGRYPLPWLCGPQLLPQITPSSLGLRRTKSCSEQTTQSPHVSSFGPGSGTLCPAGRLRGLLEWPRCYNTLPRC